MLVEEYDYVQGNTAVNPQRKYNNTKKTKKNINIDKNKKKKLIRQEKIRKRNAALQIALVIFVLGVITIWRDSKVYRLQTEVGTINSDIKKVTSDNEALKVELLKHASLKNIESNAKNKLKMISTVDAKKVNIDLSKDYLSGLGNVNGNK